MLGPYRKKAEIEKDYKEPWWKVLFKLVAQPATLVVTAVVFLICGFGYVAWRADENELAYKKSVCAPDWYSHTDNPAHGVTVVYCLDKQLKLKPKIMTEENK